MQTGTLRPLSTGELLDRTFTLFRQHFGLFAGIMMVPALFQAAATLMQLAIPAMAASGLSPSAAIGLGIGAVVMSLAYAVANLLAQGAAIAATAQIQVGKSITIREAYDEVSDKYFVLLLTGLLLGLAVLGGAILLIIPGIWVFLRGALVFQVATLEDLRYGEALRRSFALTKGAVGKIVLVYLFVIVIYFLAAGVFEFPVLLLVPSPWGETLGALGGIIALVLAGPVASIAFSLVYFDQRVRNEAFDLEVMMNALDRPAPPPAVPPAAGSIPPAFS